MAYYYYNDAAFQPIPDLYYDQQELPSPPSATSSNIISTPPPLDWQPWATAEQKPELYQPIWPEYDWMCEPQEHSQALDPSSILFSSYEQPPAQEQPPAPPSGTAFFEPSHTTPPHPAPRTSPPAPEPDQTPLKLHQPRPSRRIPIVSLSRLALACDEFQIHPKEPSAISGEVNHLPFRTAPSKSYHPMAYHSSNQFNKQSSHLKNDIYGTGFPGNTGRLTQCSCGCMAPYTCQ